MNPHGDDKPEPNDSDQALRLIELELAQRRAQREKAGTPYSGFRTASFIFLFIVIAGILFAVYYIFIAGGLDDARARAAHPSATPTAHAP